LKREAVFARDGHRCVYCGEVFPSDELTIDHVQPRTTPAALANFQRYARHVWPRHWRALEEEMGSTSE
jgi:5-methylcytosine-specific restriction endonuclease McrA